MTNLVQQLINEFGVVSALAQISERGIKVTWCENHRLVSLKYDQLESDMSDPLVQQCRGMVVDVSLGEVVAWPFNKFWNLGESMADAVDWSTASVLDKLDGSLMILYWDKTEDRWTVASSGHPTAGGTVNKSEMKFRDLFWKVWADLDYQVESSDWVLDADYTYIFELCTMENRIVVPHAEQRLVLIGIRHTRTGEECSLDVMEDDGATFGWEVVRALDLSSAEACVAAAAELAPHSDEGFVVVDAQHRRVKIKSPRYVAIHHMKGEFSRRRAVELWQTGETSELAAYFPELMRDITEVAGVLDAVVDDGWAFLAPLALGDVWPSRKAFAMVVKDRPWSGAAFKMFGRAFTRADLRAALASQSLASLERIEGVL